MRAHLFGAERAIEPGRERRSVPHRVPERFRRLSRQGAARAVGDRAGDHDRHADAALLAQLGDRIERRLGVERVEDRLDQQQLDAAVEQPARLFGIGGFELVERDGAEARPIDVGRERGGAVGRPHRAGYEPRPAVLLGRDRRRLAREPRPVAIELVDEFLHAVIGLRDRRRREGVGRGDVGARAEIIEMDIAYRVRLREIEQIVVAAYIALPFGEARAAIAGFAEPERLDHGAHGTVEHENALGREVSELGLHRRYFDGYTASRHRFNELGGCSPSPRRGEGRGEGAPTDRACSILARPRSILAPNCYWTAHRRSRASPSPRRGEGRGEGVRTDRPRSILAPNFY